MSARAKALIIDHNDSFTHNLRSWLSYGFDVEIINYKNIDESSFTTHDKKNYDLVVLSAGPKSAEDYPESLEFLKGVASEQPVLGICLGFQMMCLSENGKVEVYTPPLHGKTSRLKVPLKKFSSFENSVVARYHSMHCQLSSAFEILAVCDEPASIIMAAENKNKKWLGYQFHPESFLTEKSLDFCKYLLAWINK